MVLVPCLAAWCLSASSVFAFSVPNDGAFNYGEISEPILSATLSLNVAALTAHRTLLGHEVNHLELVDINTNFSSLSLSDALFGTTAWPAPATINLANYQTAVMSAPIPASFYPSVASGSLGLTALLTDTGGDAAFALDSIWLTIQVGSRTIASTITSEYGAPHDGFGLGIPDFGDLPGPVCAILPAGSTGTGFHECLASKSIDKTPEPACLFPLILAVLTIHRKKTRHR